MSELSLIKTTSGKISSLPIKDGQLVFTSDIPSIYWDTSNSSRVKFTDILDVETEEEREDILAPIAKYYFVKESSRLYRYLDGNWIPIGDALIDTKETFIATSNQNLFTLSHTPSLEKNVNFFVNGLIYTKDTDYIISGNQITWIATEKNGGFDLKDGFVIDIEYSYLL